MMLTLAFETILNMYLSVVFYFINMFASRAPGKI